MRIRFWRGGISNLQAQIKNMSFLQTIYTNAVNLNHRNILDLFEKNENAHFLDLGCDDGEVTMKMAEKIGTKNVSGVEIVPERIKMSESNGIIVKNFDLNGKFDFEDNSIDVIHANQVIEHLHNSDMFVGEIHRILKKGGYAIISTENASSWCNIFASIMGWQIFSLTNFSSKKQGIGNPLALHGSDANINADFSSWNHIRIYNIRGLKEYFEVFDFKVKEIRGAGYFPLLGVLGDIDKTHCHFMTFKVEKI